MKRSVYLMGVLLGISTSLIVMVLAYLGNAILTFPLLTINIIITIIVVYPFAQSSLTKPDINFRSRTIYPSKTIFAEIVIR